MVTFHPQHFTFYLWGKTGRLVLFITVVTFGLWGKKSGGSFDPAPGVSRIIMTLPEVMKQVESRQRQEKYNIQSIKPHCRQAMQLQTECSLSETLKISLNKSNPSGGWLLLLLCWHTGGSWEKAGWVSQTGMMKYFIPHKLLCYSYGQRGRIKDIVDDIFEDDRVRGWSCLTDPTVEYIIFLYHEDS